MDIPDHPEIACCLATGYPHPQRHDIEKCCDCGDALVDQEKYDWDGDLLCESCLKDRIEENIDISDIADALGIKHTRAIY